MNIYTLERTQKLPITLEQSWEFYSDPNNLKEITPPDLGLKMSPPIKEKMYSGQFITYTLHPFGVPMRWATEIKHVNEPFFFVDEQRFGPYKFWYHRHFFKEIEGGVEVNDVVNYGLHGWIFSSLINVLVIKKQLDYIFDYRYQVLEEKFGKL